eukprot:4793715-Pyramimonas_sp.AAC.1
MAARPASAPSAGAAPPPPRGPQPRATAWNVVAAALTRRACAQVEADIRRGPPTDRSSRHSPSTRKAPGSRGSSGSGALSSRRSSVGGSSICAL